MSVEITDSCPEKVPEFIKYYCTPSKKMLVQ